MSAENKDEKHAGGLIPPAIEAIVESMDEMKVTLRDRKGEAHQMHYSQGTLPEQRDQFRSLFGKLIGHLIRWEFRENEILIEDLRAPDESKYLMVDGDSD